jgi:hypothetical protein
MLPCFLIDIPSPLMLASSSISSSSNYSVSALSLATTSIAAATSVSHGSGTAEVAPPWARDPHPHTHHLHALMGTRGSMDQQAASGNSAACSAEALRQLAALLKLRRLVIESGTLSFLTASRLPPQLVWVDGLEVTQLGDNHPSSTTRRGGNARFRRYRSGVQDTTRASYEREALTPELVSTACTRIAPLVKGRDTGEASLTVCFPPTSHTAPYGHLAGLLCSLAPLSPLRALTLEVVALGVAEIESLALGLGAHLEVLGLQQARAGAPLLDDPSAPGAGHVAAALMSSFPKLTTLELGFGCGLAEEGRQVWGGCWGSTVRMGRGGPLGCPLT